MAAMPGLTRQNVKARQRLRRLGTAGFTGAGFVLYTAPSKPLGDGRLLSSALPGAAATSCRLGYFCPARRLVR